MGGGCRRVSADPGPRARATLCVPMSARCPAGHTQRKLEKREVDQRMVRALADLPSHLAEEALVRYARSLDDNVRNRQGFMVRRAARA